MNGGMSILIIAAVAAFCVGAAVFWRVFTRRGVRAALVGWAACGAVVVALGWVAYGLDASRGAAIFTGLILPAWLIGGLPGLLAGTVRHWAVRHGARR